MFHNGRFIIYVATDNQLRKPCISLIKLAMVVKRTFQFAYHRENFIHGDWFVLITTGTPLRYFVGATIFNCKEERTKKFGMEVSKH